MFFFRKSKFFFLWLLITSVNKNGKSVYLFISCVEKMQSIKLKKKQLLLKVKDSFVKRKKKIVRSVNAKEKGNDMLAKWTDIVVISALVIIKETHVSNWTLFYFVRTISFTNNTAQVVSKMTHCRRTRISLSVKGLFFHIWLCHGNYLTIFLIDSKSLSSFSHIVICN